MVFYLNLLLVNLLSTDKMKLDERVLVLSLSKQGMELIEVPMLPLLALDLDMIVFPLCTLTLTLVI